MLAVSVCLSSVCTAPARCLGHSYSRKSCGLNINDINDIFYSNVSNLPFWVVSISFSVIFNSGNEI